MLVAAADNLERRVAGSRDAFRHLRSLMGSIGDDAFDEWKQSSRSAQQLRRNVAIQLVGRRITVLGLASRPANLPQLPTNGLDANPWQELHTGDRRASARSRRLSQTGFDANQGQPPATPLS